MVVNALAAKPLPVYGDGKNVRDWLYVLDHCEGLRTVLAKGKPGNTYNIGGGHEISNIELVRTLCRLLDELRPNARLGSHSELITFVTDRPGHDRRYGIDSTKLRRELGWAPRESFESTLQITVQWYLKNQAWVEDVQSGSYQEWIALNYQDRGVSGGA
jgi:dTDP-glucose 4,6-dehydratase